MAKGRIYCRDKRGREVPWGLGHPCVDFTIKDKHGNAHRTRKRIDASSKDQAGLIMARMMAEEVERLGSFDAVELKAVPIGLAIDEWETIVSRTRKPHSTRLRAAGLRRFASWIGEGVALQQIDARAVSEFIGARLDAGIKPTTAKTDLINLSAFFSWCMALPRAWIDANPTASVPRPDIRKKRPEGVGDWDDVKAILAKVAGHERLEPAYILAFSTLGREEIVQAKWTDIDFENRTIRVSAGNIGKTETRDAILPLFGILFEWLKEHRKESGFIVPFERRDNGRPEGERLQTDRDNYNRSRPKEERLPGFHKGRHTIATLISKTAPLPVVQQLLRHSSPTTTASYYIGLKPLDARDALDALE